MKRLLPAVAGALALVAVVRWMQAPEAGAPLRRRELMMDTLVTITCYPRAGVDAEAAVEAALGRMRAVERIFSSYLPDTPLARLNRQGHLARAEAPDELVAVLEAAVALHQASGGRFDAGLGQLLGLWGFGPGAVQGGPPAPEVLAQALAAGGIAGLTLAPDQLRLAPGVALDLGGHAKGYAVDEAVRLLQAAGLAALVDAGGDMAATGPKPGGAPWRVGIRDPGSEGGVLGVLLLDGGAVATSGDYERFYEWQGERVHHLLDPTTGVPARVHVQATVRAARCAEADAWATALFVSPPEEAAALAAKAGVSALLLGPGDARQLLGGFAWEPRR